MPSMRPMHAAVLLAALCTVRVRSAPSKVCGAKAGADCPDNFCVTAGSTKGKCVKIGNQIHWSGVSMVWPKPANAANKNCGAAAGTNCPSFVCVDKKHAKGTCTSKGGVWTFSAKAPTKSTGGTGGTSGSGKDVNCGAAAGTDCPRQMCVPKKYNGKGTCSEVAPGKWRWNSGSMPA